MIRIHCDVCGDDITDDDTWHHAHDGHCPVDFDESCCCNTYCARCCPTCGRDARLTETLRDVGP
jgi:hypothetical protein